MGHVTSLFASDPLLDWLPNETLFSLASRNHVLWGNGQWWRTSEMLFGSRRLGCQHDLPSGIGAFVEQTGGLLGTPETIARERTLLYYYGRFLDAGEEQGAVETLASHSVQHLKLRLGILTSRFRANHPLKACICCIEEDARNFGWAYWHLEHQFPGVWWCGKHDLPLQESLIKSTGVERFLWHLPSWNTLRSLASEPWAGIESAADQISSLARTTIELVSGTSSGDLTPDRLYVIYQAEVARRGWLTDAGNLCLTEIAPGFLEYAKPLRRLPELVALPTTIDEAKAQIGRLLRPMRSGTHPLRHVLLIDWLFGGAEQVIAYARSEFVVKDDEGNGLMNSSAADEMPDKELLKDRLADILEQGQSVRNAADELGIDTATAMVWAAQRGITVSRRPKILKDDQRQKLIKLLRSGVDKAEAAKRLGIAVVTVTHFLRTEVGLHDAWRQARHRKARDRARKAWCSLVAAQGQLGTKLLRSLNPAAYAWLYRHDRKWLQEHLPPRLPANPAVTAHRIAWDRRDLALSAAVEAAALAISSTTPQARIPLWRLYQEVPELKAKLSALDRLPLTRRVIERTLAHRSGKRVTKDLLA